jgi:formylglycine-generating enzyme required for sulfatase activity
MGEIEQAKLEALHERWQRIFKRINSVQAQHDLETRVEERIRMELILAQDRQSLHEIEREIAAFQECIKQNTGWNPQKATDEYGIYADLRVGNVVQRMRWIEPGTFLMGSPPDERGRGANELQHEVTLTRGFWLADTACTQTLWQAVMGSNPSNFKGAELPVETVDWYKVQKFLRKLGEKVSGLKARLPTEAEWEYACRAGTTTAFAFGESVTAQQVQVDGKQTLAVKSLPANPWGLYAMHGNVWEWCQDGYGEYPAGAVVDPVGDDGSDLRVLRGGSWVNGSEQARSAARGRSIAGNADYNIGLRIAAT